MRPRRHLALARTALGVVLVVAAAALIWPGPQAFTERIEPSILGLPFAFGWVVAWLLVVFGAVLTYHLVSGEEG